MKILIIGEGGRENALAWKLSQSAMKPQIFGNSAADGGMGLYAECVGQASDVAGDVADFCLKTEIDLVVIGPEAPLMDGLADTLRASGIHVFGPSAKAAQLEGSKIFTRKLCAEYNIPSPGWEAFDDEASAKNYTRMQKFPVVVKADGLAAGKGVVIAENQQQADEAIANVFTGKFGTPLLLIEEYMQGEEVSFFVLTDGKTVQFFGTAQDHKRAFDGDEGPNTGGMGAFSPAVILTREQELEVMKKIIEPTLSAMREKEMVFTGVLYAGLMLTQEGIKLVEYNVRFGDPECQLLMMRLKSDLLPLLLGCAQTRLAEQEILWRNDYAALVVLAARGYPGGYEKGSVIGGMEAAAQCADVEIFHAATLYKEGDWLANGGRVLNLAAHGKTLKNACTKAYTAIDKIDWKEGFYRRDIGKKFIEF